MAADRPKGGRAGRAGAGPGALGERVGGRRSEFRFGSTVTTSTTRKPAKPRPADTCRLSVTSRGVTSTTRPIRPEASDVIRAWRLRKADGRAPGGSYTVADTSDGPTCDGADYTFRHVGHDQTGCKHVRALRFRPSPYCRDA